MGDFRRSVRRPLGRLLAVGYYGFIFFLSAQSGFPVKAPFSGFDKLAHLGIFGVWGALLAWGLSDPDGPPRAGRLLPAFLIGALGGALDEVHQIFVPGRSAEVGDAAADLIGAAAGILVIAWILRRRNRGGQPGK
jgi:VanZ family protein